ncbi:MAG: hypothetical protein CL610_16755 [Anaerolineaceae bacterium]|nr:hypothetical protein [Anaerolineaceae bacterium]
MILTWKLWRALLTPPVHHPLFRWIGSQPSPGFQGLVTLIGPVGMSLLVGLVALGIWHDPYHIMPLLLNPSVAAVIGFLLFTGTVYGLIWATTICALFKRLRESGQYDLLLLAPSTALTINWAICTGLLYRSQSFTRINRQRARITHLLLMLTTILFIPLLLGLSAGHEPYINEMLSIIIHIMTLTFAFQVDHIQSIIMGTLVGLNVPQWLPQMPDARLLAGVIFLMLQLTSYLLSWWIGFEALPQIIMLDSHLNAFGLPVLRVVVFCICREAMIAALWHLLIHRLHLQPAPVDGLIPHR